MPSADVYDLFADQDAADASALAAIGKGDLDLLRELIAALESLSSSPFVTRYLVAILQVFEEELAPPGSPLNPEVLIGEAAAEGSDTQREAGAARLHRLAALRPEYAERLRALAAALAPPAAS